MNASTGLPLPQRRWAAFSLAASIVVTVIDASMVTVMLPVIAQTFSVSPAQAIWVMTSYQLTLACFLLPVAALGEKYGQWLIYSVGLALFGIGAIGSAMSTTLATLIAGRVLQGVGAAGIQSMIMALLRHSYPVELFGRAAGVNSSVVGVAMASGPALGAAILAFSEWRMLFFLSLPIAVFSAAVGIWALPRVARPSVKFDPLSALLTSLAILAFVLGLNELRSDVHPLRMAAMLGLAAVLIALTVRRLRGEQDPVLPVDLLSIRIITLSMTTALFIFSAQAIAMITLPFYLAQTTSLSPGAIGLLITPWPVGMAIMANVSGRLAERHSARLICAAGIACMFASSLSLALIPDNPAPVDVLWRVALFGLGFGTFVTPNNRLIMLNTPLRRAGATGSLVASTRMLGLSIGATLAALAFSYWPQDPGHAAFAVGCVLMVVAFCLCLVRRTPQERA